MRNFLDKPCIENQNTHFMSINFFQKSCRVRDNVEKCDGARRATDYITIWCIRVACWISKATCTHMRANTDKYVIFIPF